MITLRIGSESREINSKRDIDESWINSQINRRRQDGLSICAQVTIHDDNLNIVLTTPGCGTGIGGGRQPNPSERTVLDLWAKRGLNDYDFTVGNLIAFLDQLLKQ
jgi:hypothetical protein